MRICPKRRGTPEDVAAAVTVLASPEVGFITVPARGCSRLVLLAAVPMLGAGDLDAVSVLASLAGEERS